MSPDEEEQESEIVTIGLVSDTGSVDAALESAQKSVFKEIRAGVPTMSGYLVNMEESFLYTSEPFSDTSTSEASSYEEEHTFKPKREKSDEELLDSWGRFLALHIEDLRNKHKGKYIAVYNDRVFDEDADLAQLAKRVYKKLGYRAVFIPYID